MTEALQRIETQALVKPTTERAIVMARALQEETEQRAIVRQYVRDHMVVGVDVGRIPGTQKDTLLKPGAEKLVDLFRCTARFVISHKVEDWDRGLFHYEFKVEITSRDSGTVLAEGFGSANSKEGRYRWRNSARKCPSCGKDTISKSKDEWGGGWYCATKRGGCGAKWAKGAAEIESQEIGHTENDDIFTLVNTILKMAKKRALVDASLALSRCSDIFEQDLEDLDDDDIDGRGNKNKPRNGESKSDASLGNVLSAIDCAQTLDELVNVQPHAARLGSKDKETARKAYSRKRDEIMAHQEQRSEGSQATQQDEPPHDPETGEVIEEPQPESEALKKVLLGIDLAETYNQLATMPKEINKLSGAEKVIATTAYTEKKAALGFGVREPGAEG
jgi:hypothetical protein